MARTGTYTVGGRDELETLRRRWKARRSEEATRPFAVVEDWDSRLLITDMDRFWDDRAFRPTTTVEKTMVRRG